MAITQLQTSRPRPKHSMMNSGSGYGRVVDRALATLRIGFGLTFLWAFFDQLDAGSGGAWVDWLYRAGLLGTGVALTLGITLRLAAGTGALLYVLMWTDVLRPEYLLGAATLVVLALTYAGDTWGLGRKWLRLFVVSRHPVLE